MTTYTAIPGTDIDQDSPVTQTLMTLMRDNPIAIAEGATGAPDVAGSWILLETQEPTSDVSAITFTTDVSGYRDVMVSFYGQPSTNIYIQIEGRVTAGTWRTLFRSYATGTADDVMAFCVVVQNTDNGDGSGVQIAHPLVMASIASPLNRSSNTSLTQQTHGGAYYTGVDAAALNEMRVAVSTGTIRGATASSRAQAKLYGIPRLTKDA